jgi:hypothetical protein
MISAQTLPRISRRTPPTTSRSCQRPNRQTAIHFLIGDAAGIERPQAKPRRHAKGEESQGIWDPAMTVYVYVNTGKQVGDAEHVKVFTTTNAAETWFEGNDPGGVVFEYEVE